MRALLLGSYPPLHYPPVDGLCWLGDPSAASSPRDFWPDARTSECAQASERRERMFSVGFGGICIVLP